MIYIYIYIHIDKTYAYLVSLKRPAYLYTLKVDLVGVKKRLGFTGNQLKRNCCCRFFSVTKNLNSRGLLKVA